MTKREYSASEVHCSDRRTLGPLQERTRQALGLQAGKSTTWLMDRLFRDEKITEDQHQAAKALLSGWDAVYSPLRVKTANYGDGVGGGIRTDKIARVFFSDESAHAYRIMMADRYDLWLDMMFRDTNLRYAKGKRWANAAHDVIVDQFTIADAASIYSANHQTVMKAIVYGLQLYAWTHYRGEQPTW